MRNENTMTVQEVAKRLQVGPQRIRSGIISGKLPIGVAIKQSDTYSFIIPRKRFEAWESGKDLIPVINNITEIKPETKEATRIDMADFAKQLLNLSDKKSV